jgi:hypothetical protein
MEDGGLVSKKYFVTPFRGTTNVGERNFPEPFI